MDKKAKKILFNTYWSKNGWKENTERYPSPEDFIYAKEKGLMFDPFTISHDDCVKNIVQLGKIITTNQVARAFLSSLSTRRLDWRSAIASYSVAKKITIHKYIPVEYGRFYDADNAVTHIGYTCAICQNSRYGIIGQENYINVDLNVLNFERIKWGGVRHGQLIYTLFDLEQFAKETIPQPQSEDIEIFREILKAIKSCDPTDYPSALSHKLAMIPLLKSNKDERNIIIEILACIGILVPKSYNRPEAPKHDWTYATYWRGEDGYNTSEVEKYFGEYL
ncbi:hypothetical protein B5E84_04100 [Lachnoclostridium sp. An14]|uniref:hypothetical protein n=1 Tax=Lachnoclostridium sp. An14 TaxID=1965562 RepID=UPI000B3961E0|nr:hypothetical protein [Lachnoclostridium sp. An14]OUQ21173.1 hypothetical protein B5E84_04100 [Lachnoclostridium sp. An14]